jgi:hypothetical protein
MSSHIDAASSNRPGEWSTLTSLEKILNWMKAQGVPATQIDIIAQDEYCHDLLVPWQDGWLVFGMT